MARLVFRFTPRDTVDFDVCADPPRPAPTARPEPAPPEPAPPAQRERTPQPAEG